LAEASVARTPKKEAPAPGTCTGASGSVAGEPVTGLAITVMGSETHHKPVLYTPLCIQGNTR